MSFVTLDNLCHIKKSWMFKAGLEQPSQFTTFLKVDYRHSCTIVGVEESLVWNKWISFVFVRE